MLERGESNIFKKTVRFVGSTFAEIAQEMNKAHSARYDRRSSDPEEIDTKGVDFSKLPLVSNKPLSQILREINQGK